MQGAYGRRGRIGGVASLVGLALMVVGNAAEFWLFTTQAYAEANGRQASWGLFLLGMLLLAVGSVLFGIATMRAGILPRLGGLLVVVWLGSAGTLGAGWVVLGYAVWSGRGRAAQRPARVR